MDRDFTVHLYDLKTKGKNALSLYQVGRVEVYDRHGCFVFGTGGRRIKFRNVQDFVQREIRKILNDPSITLVVKNIKNLAETHHMLLLVKRQSPALEISRPLHGYTRVQVVNHNRYWDTIPF